MADRRPNVVLVTFDSLRADHCGFMGYERDTTPTLDAMAADGLVFENAIASGVPTISSMTAVMTGEHSLASPEIGFDTEQREQVTSRPTIAEVLADAGYATGGLSPNPPASSYFGFDDGFDWFEDFLAADGGIVERAWNRVFRNSIAGGGLSTSLRLFKNVVTRDEILRPWEDFYDEILAWRERVEEPYFLWVLLLEPHHPWLPPTAFQRWSSRTDKYRAFRQYYEMYTGGWEPAFDDAERDRLVNLYDDSIRYGDAFLARLRSDLGDDDPTFVIHADHGEEFGERGRYGHQPYLTEALLDVPLVIAGDVDDTGRVERPVALKDLAPTIADVAGIEHPFAGRSVLDGTSDAPWVTAKVFADGDRRAAVRTAAAKYVREDERERLLDLETGERKSLEDGENAVFRDVLDGHVSHEREVRRIRTGASETVAGEEHV